jgi:hypothetical protein
LTHREALRAPQGPPRDQIDTFSNHQITVVRLKLGNKTLYLIFNWLDKDKLVCEKAAPMYFK